MIPDDQLSWEEPILLELAVDDDGLPPSDSSWMGGLAGTSLSILFHLWLLFTLSGIVFDDREPLDPEPLDTRFTNEPVPDVPSRSSITNSPIPTIARWKSARRSMRPPSEWNSPPSRIRNRHRFP